MVITLEQELYFLSIAQEIVNKIEYQELRKYNHHYTLSRYDHCFDVAYYAYVRALKSNRNLDLKSIIRAALLHDFFLYDLRKQSIPKHLSSHPKTSLDNALEYFELNKLEHEIILCHMWPLSKERPKSKEAKLVNSSDKICSLYELLRLKKRIRIKKYKFDFDKDGNVNLE